MEDSEVTFEQMSESLGGKGDKLVLAWRYNQTLKQEIGLGGVFKNRICEYGFDLSKCVSGGILGTDHKIDLDKLSVFEPLESENLISSLQDMISDKLKDPKDDAIFRIILPNFMQYDWLNGVNNSKLAKMSTLI